MLRCSRPPPQPRYLRSRMPIAIRPLLESAWVEPFALLGAKRRAAALTDAARERMRPWVQGARARYRVALELRDAETRAVALGLLHTAAWLALCAAAAAQGNEEPKAASAAWAAFDADAAGAPPPELELVKPFFSSDAPLAADLLDPARALELRQPAELVVAWLFELVEARSPREIDRARIVRSLLLVLGLALVITGLVSYWLMLNQLAARG